MASADTIPILYIAGTGRSGSTILGNVLGQLEGFFHAGELWHFWDDGLLSNLSCGCGTAFRNCPLWREVSQQALGRADELDAEQMILLRNTATRTRHIPFLFTPSGRRRVEKRLAPFLSRTEALYAALRKVTGCRVIVDSSKNPAYAYLLSMLPRFELSILHLVRDPRGVAFSSTRKKFRPDTQGHLEPTGPLRTALFWVLWNLAIVRLAKNPSQPCLRLRYEDFVADPRVSVHSVLELFPGSPSDLSFIGQGAVELRTQHTLSGNPSRFQSGTVHLRADEEWKKSMKQGDRMAVTALTWPWRAKLGYGRSSG